MQETLDFITTDAKIPSVIEMKKCALKRRTTRA